MLYPWLNMANEWLPAVTHCCYWLAVLSLNRESYKQDEDVEGPQITHIFAIRMFHFGLMGFGILVFTGMVVLLTRFTSMFMPVKPSYSYPESNPSGNQPGSVVTTSYQQHSSSAEERKYMQQQLMQFNAQSRDFQDQPSDDDHSKPKPIRVQLSQKQNHHKSFDHDLHVFDPITVVPSQPRLNEPRGAAPEPNRINDLNISNGAELRIQDNAESNHLNSSKPSEESSSKIVYKSQEDILQTQGTKKRQGTKAGDSSHMHSYVHFNGKIFVNKEQQNIEMKGNVSWYIVLHNYKLHMLFIGSAILNAVAQLMLAYSLDITLQANNSPNSSWDIMCWIKVNSSSLIMIVFGFTHQFLIAPNTQSDENLPLGIYSIFVVLTCTIITFFLLESNFLATRLSFIAFTLIGARLLLIKLYLQGQKVNCLLLNLFHLWAEFSVMLIFYFTYYQYLDTPQFTFTYSYADYMAEIGISMIYVVSVITSNANVMRQSLFTFTNQFILASAIAFMWLLAQDYLTLDLVIYAGVLALAVYLAYLMYYSCKAFVSGKLNARKQQLNSRYGASTFHADHLERLLPLHQQQADFLSYFQRPISAWEYYIVENDVSILLRKRPCLDQHYKFNSIQHFSLKFYSINSCDLSQSQETNQYLDKEDEQRLFLRAIQSYQRRLAQ